MIWRALNIKDTAIICKICLFMIIYIYIYIYVCVCVCVGGNICKRIVRSLGGCTLLNDFRYYDITITILFNSNNLFAYKSGFNSIN